MRPKSLLEDLVQRRLGNLTNISRMLFELAAIAFAITGEFPALPSAMLLDWHFVPVIEGLASAIQRFSGNVGFRAALAQLPF